MQPEQVDRLLSKVEELTAATNRCSEVTAVCVQRLDALQNQASWLTEAIYSDRGLQARMAEMNHRVAVLEKIVWGVTMTIILGFVGAVLAIVTKT